MILIRQVLYADVPFLTDVFQRSLSQRYGPKDFATFVHKFVQEVLGPPHCVRMSKYQHHMYMAMDTESNEFLGTICFCTKANDVASFDALVLRGDARRKCVARLLFTQVRHYNSNYLVAQMYRVIPVRIPSERRARDTFTVADLQSIEQKHRLYDQL